MMDDDQLREAEFYDRLRKELPWYDQTRKIETPLDAMVVMLDRLETLEHQVELHCNEDHP